jgi:hypothetical protein
MTQFVGAVAVEPIGRGSDDFKLVVGETPEAMLERCTGQFVYASGKRSKPGARVPRAVREWFTGSKVAPGGIVLALSPEVFVIEAAKQAGWTPRQLQRRRFGVHPEAGKEEEPPDARAFRAWWVTRFGYPANRFAYGTWWDFQVVVPTAIGLEAAKQLAMALARPID